MPFSKPPTTTPTTLTIFLLTLLTTLTAADQTPTSPLSPTAIQPRQNSITSFPDPPSTFPSSASTFNSDFDNDFNNAKHTVQTGQKVILGLGIGLGIGIPLLIAAFVACFCLHRKNKRAREAQFVPDYSAAAPMRKTGGVGNDFAVPTMDGYHSAPRYEAAPGAGMGYQAGGGGAVGYDAAGVRGELPPGGLVEAPGAK